MRILFQKNYRVPIQQLDKKKLPQQNIEAAVLRLDQLHAEISGNKWFKLKYNLAAAKASGKNTILTFGGAYSNHIAATAAACAQAGSRSIGIIRGEKPEKPNHTLQFAEANGMRIYYVSRDEYRKKNDENFINQLINIHGEVYIIPEGGNNALGVKGCEEILSINNTSHYTHICCAVGTGTTLAGIINSARPEQQILGFPALKNADYLNNEIKAFLINKEAHNWRLINDYHFGGFAKIKPPLIDFINGFYNQSNIPLDIVYTGKMLFGIFDLMRQNYFPVNSSLLIIHSGGLQGNKSLPAGTLNF